MTFFPKTRKIPTLIGLLLVLVLTAVVGLSTSAVKEIQKLFTSADSGILPTSVGVANITDTSFTVYWLTEKPVGGAVFYGLTPELGLGVAVDERSQGGQTEKYQTHFVRVTNLKPTTDYYFKISSGPSVTGDPEASGAPYTVSTGPTLGDTPAIEPIYGRLQDLPPNFSGIALWEADGAARLASLVKSSGDYVVPLAAARTIDLTAFWTEKSGFPETITILSPATDPTQINCELGRDRPLPNVRLGETINCRRSSSPSPASSPSARFRPPQATTISLGEVNIVEGETIPTPLPIIRGNATPDVIIRIQIDGKTPYSGTVRADSAGDWSWTPPANLSPGPARLTVSFTNASGSKVEIVRNFIVPGSDPILGISTGTPSGSLHKSCVNNACVEVEGDGEDSCILDSDCQPAPPPAPPPTPPPAPPPTPTPPPPVTGTVENGLLLLTGGLIFLTLGLGIFFERKKS